MSAPLTDKTTKAPSATTPQPNPSTPAKTQPTTSVTPASGTVGGATGAPPTTTAKPTQALTDRTSPQPTTVTSSFVTTATNKPTQQATALPSNVPTMTKGTPPAGNPGPAATTNAVTEAATTTGSGGVGLTIGPLARITASTQSPPNLHTGAVESVTKKAPMDAPTTKQGSQAPVAVTTFSPTQGGGKGATDKVSPTSLGPAAPSSTQPPGNLWTRQTTLSPTTLAVTRDAGATPSRPATIAITTTVPATTTTINVTTTSAPPKKFIYSLLSEQESKEERELAEVCRRLMPDWQNGTCTLTWRHHDGKVRFDLVEINGKVKTSLASQLYEEITKKPTDNRTLIIILASCGALLIMIVILAVCASHRRKPYNENQQHLTEELHTVENGYHDNPTLEVMEVQPEMQEKKKLALNGEFNDSWIVPFDSLRKDDGPDEEDTHL